MLRAFLAACAVGVIALTLTLGSLHRPKTIVVSLPPPPPLSRSVAAPVLSAPPVHVVARPRSVVTKKRVARVATVVQPDVSVLHKSPATRERPTPVPPAPPVPPTTTPTAPKTPSIPTTPVTPVPAPPVATPAGPPVDTTPVVPTSQPLEPPPATTPPVTTEPPPVVPPPPVTDDQTRPGNGWGDKNHVHTGPPGHGK